MDNFDLRKYLAEGKLYENLQIDDIFGEYVAQWSQGNYDYDFADLKSGSVKGSLVDDFTLGPDEYDDDEYVRDYKIMRDYLLKNRSYKLSQDEKEGLSQFPVQFTLDDDGETIKADIYYSPEYLAMVDADLDEGLLFEEDDTVSVYIEDQDKEVDIDISGATKNQKGLIDYAIEIEEFPTIDDAKGMFKQLMKINSEDEVAYYYEFERGFGKEEEDDWKLAMLAFRDGKVLDSHEPDQVDDNV